MLNNEVPAANGRSNTDFKVQVHSSSAPAGKQDYESQPNDEAATTTD